MGKKQYKSTEEKVVGWFVLAMIGLGALSAIWPLLIAGGIGYGLYHLGTRQKRLTHSKTALRLEELKDSIGRADRQLNLLDEYLAKKNYPQYALLSHQLLPQLQTIREEANQLKSSIDKDIYQRIITKIHQVTTGIQEQLEQIGLTSDPAALSKEEEELMTLAPELLTSYRNIRADDQVIREKIKLSENRAELAALHDANMNRFDDILSGYLKIKAAPKDYHKADERLAQAKAALEQFDLQLDDTLRELNEDDLSDFEVSLRLMSKKETGYEA